MNLLLSKEQKGISLKSYFKVTYTYIFIYTHRHTYMVLVKVEKKLSQDVNETITTGIYRIGNPTPDSIASCRV